MPPYLILIGGSYIGLEFAQMYRFGSEVMVIEKSSTILQREDEDVSAIIKKVLESEGINFRLNAECISPEKQARESGRNVLVGKRAMERIGRAVEKGETEGFMKVLVDADSRKIQGTAIIGLNGDEVVHSITDVMYADAPYTVIQRAMHIHPTVSELIPTMLVELKPLQGT